ncbi:MAG: nicotinate phosphoribosyltransferase [Chloroflexi bacterium]|nr:MAG: nicotinate phosphoribosyltransferase [Chloroflexota bacterium]
MSNPRPIRTARDRGAVALSTDLYQLTMGAGYDALGMEAPATFSLFVRALPQVRSFLVVAGVAEALEKLTSLRFDAAGLDYLRSTGQIRAEFIERLATLRFTGDVWAVPDGRVVFANEPVLEVTAPVIEAQLAETLLINCIHYPMTVASKAVRSVWAAPQANMIDFGLRRTPGLEAGLEVARVCAMVGFTATSNLLAGEQFGLPVAGTVAHSFIEAFDSELEAFRAFARTFPGPVTLLIDTYDTLRGAHHAVQVARELAAEGRRVGAVRIDSGDLAALSRGVRAILDDGGFPDIRIIASGGLDEYQIAQLTAANAPIDAYGVGTRIGSSEDAPTLDMVYKLVEYDGRPALKLSSGKQTLVGPKQVWRRYAAGRMTEDVIAARDEPSPGEGWHPLLAPVVQQGRILSESSLAEARARHVAEMATLPPELHALDHQAEYPVNISPELARRNAAAIEAVRQREG